MEGPSLVILCEELKSFVNKKILAVDGNSKENIDRLTGKKILGFKSWGKHFLILFDTFYVRIHFLMFGSYRIDEIRENRIPRLYLGFESREINFYACSLKIFEGNIEKIYDWKVDIMSSEWDIRKVVKLIKSMPDRQVSDVLLDQNVFAGVGNIIKNEVLFILKLHPETLVKDLKTKEIKALALETRAYSFRFLEWKKIFVLRKHWVVYKKRKCTNCGTPILSILTGKGQRRTYMCPICQAKAPIVI